MKVIKYLCNPHTLAYPSNVSPRTFQLFLFAGSSRYHHHRCRRRKGEGEWKERERGKNWSATRRLRPSWINEARAVPIRFYRFLDTTSRGGRNESASLLAACARNEKLNVSREREGRGGERERERGTRETFGRKISQLSSVIRRCVVQFSTSTANFRILLLEHPRIEEGRGTDKAIDYKRKRGVQAYPEGAIALLLFRHHHSRNKFTKVR